MNRKFSCRCQISAFYNADSFSMAINVIPKIRSPFISFRFKIKALRHGWYFKDYFKYILICICMMIPMYSPPSELYQFRISCPSAQSARESTLHDSRYTIYPVLWPHLHIVIKQKKFTTI